MKGKVIITCLTLSVVAAGFGFSWGGTWFSNPNEVCKKTKTDGIVDCFIPQTMTDIDGNSITVRSQEQIRNVTQDETQYNQMVSIESTAN